MTTSTLSTPLSSAQLEEINAHLSTLEPQEVLAWGLAHLPKLYQSTGVCFLTHQLSSLAHLFSPPMLAAFGLTGLAGTDMLRKLTSSPPELIFIDTLYHFQETLDLKDEVRRRYGVKVNVYRPSGVNTAAEFEALYGERLWETNDAVYDYWAKVHSP